MKYAVIRQLTLIVISFSLFQSCSSADDEIYALVSVEINGISYSSKYIPNEKYSPWPSYNGRLFKLVRFLNSKDGDEVFLYLKVHEETILLNRKYTDVEFYFDGFHGSSIKRPSVEFTRHYDDFYGNHKIKGLFEFDVIDSETGEIVYDVRNGMFDVPYV